MQNATFLIGIALYACVLACIFGIMRVTASDVVDPPPARRGAPGWPPPQQTADARSHTYIEFRYFYILLHYLIPCRLPPDGHPQATAGQSASAVVACGATTETSSTRPRGDPPWTRRSSGASPWCVADGRSRFPHDCSECGDHGTGAGRRRGVSPRPEGRTRATLRGGIVRRKLEISKAVS